MQIITTKKFDKNLRKQTSKIEEEFYKRLAILIKDINTPLLNVHKLSGSMKDLYSFNLSGDLRVIFYKSHENVVNLVDIGSHSELY